MLSAEVVCYKYLPNNTDKLSIEANSMDPEQSSLIWVHTVCHRGFLNISADKKSRQPLLGLVNLRVKKYLELTKLSLTLFLIFLAMTAS